MKLPKKAISCSLGVSLVGGLLWTAAWWIRREPTPTTAMESVVSYWEKWSDDVVRERVRSHLKQTNEPPSDLLQAAAETLKGAYAVELYQKAVKQDPQRAGLRLGLVRSLFASSLQTTEVVLVASARKARDPVEENLELITRELRACQELEPDNACTDYLLAYLALTYREEPVKSVLSDLDTAQHKTRFQDYCMDAAQKQAELLAETGFPKMEAQFAVVQEADYPLRRAWTELGKRLEDAGRRFLLEKDIPYAENTFQHLILLGDHLTSTDIWLEEGLAGFRMKTAGAAGLREVYNELEEKDKAEAMLAVEKEANSSYYEQRSFQWWRGRKRLEVLSADEFARYLNVFLTQGAMEANNLLLSHSW